MPVKKIYILCFIYVCLVFAGLVRFSFVAPVLPLSIRCVVHILDVQA
jgi:hypothetical protein